MFEQNKDISLLHFFFFPKSELISLTRDTGLAYINAT